MNIYLNHFGTFFTALSILSLYSPEIYLISLSNLSFFLAKILSIIVTSISVSSSAVLNFTIESFNLTSKSDFCVSIVLSLFSTIDKLTFCDLINSSFDFVIFSFSVINFVFSVRSCFKVSFV